MNTTQKGNELEELIYGWLYERVNTYGTLVKLNRHKIYHCSNGRALEVDVSIDVYMNQEFMNMNKPSQIYIFECKNLNRKLDIAEYDEWRGKIDDLGKTGHKLYIVCRKGFSEQTIKFAEENRVGLIKYPYRGDAEFVLPRSVVTYNSHSISMSNLQSEVEEDEITCYDGFSFSSLADILISNNIPILSKYRIKAPCFSNRQIEEITKEIITEHTKYNDILASMLEEEVFSNVSPKKLPHNRLGYLDIQTKKIIISADLKIGEPRYRFVLAHEYGHLILHREVLANKISILYDNDTSLQGLCISNNELQILEQQANRFAALLLMPTSEFENEVIRAFKTYDIRGNYLYVDKQPCNIQNYHKVTSRISSVFLVSKQAVTFRMKDLGLLQIHNGAIIL